MSGLFNAAGKGGGPILIALLVGTLNYETKFAIKITYAMLFGGSLGKTIIVSKLRDKVTKKPLIGYSIAMVLIPGILCGSILGRYLNTMSPSLII